MPSDARYSLPYYQDRAHTETALLANLEFLRRELEGMSRVSPKQVGLYTYYMCNGARPVNALLFRLM